jgi:hypothetical protein
VDPEPRQGHAGRRALAVRLHLDQQPFHAGQRNAPRRPEAPGYGKDLSSDSLQDYSVVRHIMARHGQHL